MFCDLSLNQIKSDKNSNVLFWVHILVIVMCTHFSNSNVCTHFSNSNVCTHFSNSNVCTHFSNSNVGTHFSNSNVCTHFSNDILYKIVTLCICSITSVTFA